MVPLSGDDDNWVVQDVIVECKHRMHRFCKTLPLYEQIQAALYCMMCGVDDADVVQVLRQKSDKGGRSTRMNYKFQVSRVSLMDNVSQHKRSWESIVLLRLRSIVDAVYMVRGEDNIRYRFLEAAARDSCISNDCSSNEWMGNDSWKLMHELCPWLLHCDTAFMRDHTCDFK